MVALDDMIGTNKVITLQGDESIGSVQGVKLPEQIERIEKNELEAAYFKDPVLFNGINLIVKTFLGAGFKIVADDPDVQKFMDDFSQRNNMMTIVLDIIQHICIYGDAWLEIIYNKQRNRIVGLDRIDPKSMDFDKDIHNRVKTDRVGSPSRYFQKVPQHLVGIRSDKLRRNDKGEIGFFFPINKVAHFKLYSVGNSFNGIGLVEPLYLTSNQKLNIQQGYANAIYRLGFPLPVAKIGDDKHEPNPDQINNLTTKLQDLNSLSTIVIPYYYNIEFQSPKNVEKLGEHLTYFRNEEITGMGIPGALVTGLGEKTNRSVLQQQSVMFERTIRLIQKVVSDAFTDQVFKIMARLESWKVVPRFEWVDVNVEDLDSKAGRLVKYAQSGLLNPDKIVRDDIRRREELPPEDQDTQTTEMNEVKKTLLTLSQKIEGISKRLDQKKGGED